MGQGARRPIVFVHVPKTAGSSVTRYLMQHCRSAAELAPTFVGDYSLFAHPDRWSVIAGHFTFSRMQWLVPHGTFITFLRDPVARAISQFRSWRDPAKMTPEWKAAMTAEEVRLFEWVYGASLEQFVMSDDPAVRRALGNPMTTFLSSDGTADVESALSNLRTRFTTFGIQESFADSIRMLRAACPWLGPYQLPTTAENRSQIAVGPVTPVIRSRIESLNAADLALYDEAAALFKERVHQAATRRAA